MSILKIKEIPKSAHSHYKYNPITGLFTALKDIGKKILKGDVVPKYSNDDYKNLIIDGIVYRAHRVAYFMYYGVQPNIIDHINHRRDCNWILNLKSGTFKENMQNIKKSDGYFSWMRKVEWDIHVKKTNEIRGKQKNNGVVVVKMRPQDYENGIRRK